MRIVVALGGNALLDPEAEPEYESQLRNVERTTDQLASLADDNELVLTHGNGPQAGNILLQQEETPPEMPLDVVVAETQGQIGYMLQRELGERLDTDPATVVTQVVVDPDDPAFDDPSKPVGPFYTADEVEGKRGTIKEVGTGEKRYRRVVPSPEPQGVVEADAIRRLIEAQAAVIASGGGGIPVTDEGKGVEAVIDKDGAAALLAEELDADMLLIVTDVDYAYRDYGTDDEEPLEELTPAEAREIADDGEFGEGSMAPKVRAAARFADRTGGKAVITSLANLDAALDGEGTTLRR
ncbi:MAG: carbamate kinase [Candidatus Nanohaloarchaea archaeon]|nr:carbamate kinase [Candidatus Nanohaloarchaea archaeon]